MLHTLYKVRIEVTDTVEAKDTDEAKEKFLEWLRQHLQKWPGTVEVDYIGSLNDLKD